MTHTRSWINMTHGMDLAFWLLVQYHPSSDSSPYPCCVVSSAHERANKQRGQKNQLLSMLSRRKSSHHKCASDVICKKETKKGEVLCHWGSFDEIVGAFISLFCSRQSPIIRTPEENRYIAPLLCVCM